MINDYMMIDEDYGIDTTAIEEAVEQKIQLHNRRLGYAILGAWMAGYEAIDEIEDDVTLPVEDDPGEDAFRFGLQYAIIPRQSIESEPIRPPGFSTTRYDCRELSDRYVRLLRKRIDWTTRSR